MEKEVSSYFIGNHVDSAGCLATMLQCTICLATAYLNVIVFKKSSVHFQGKTRREGNILKSQMVTDGFLSFSTGKVRRLFGVLIYLM